jgi:penicillin-binding protein 1A
MKFIWRLLPNLIGLVATLLLCITAGGFAAYYYLQPALPSVDEMREIPLQIPLRIYSRDGKLMEQIGEKRRTPVEYEDIPEIVVQAFLAAEDDRFFEHPGFDYQGIARAAFKLVATGSKAQGGSTITQQLAREYFLTRDRTFVRKAKELILATQIENEFSKGEILSLYLNKIFLGQRAYGVVAAAEVYFGKTLDELSIAEAATIAGLPAAPSRLNPVANPDQARDRRGYVLRRMRELKFIDEQQFQTALLSPVESFLHGPRSDLYAPYISEMARGEAIRLLGPAAYTDGYQVVTTVDSRLQRAAGNAVRTALLEYDRRHGYRGPVAQANIDEIVADFAAALEDQEDELAARELVNLSGGQIADIALQDFLTDYPEYSDLHIAIVTATFPATDGSTADNSSANSAEFYLRDRGRVLVPWDRLKWRPYVNDNVIGDAPKSVAKMLTVGDVVYLLDTRKGWQLAQLPEAQGAFVAMDPRDGAIAALTGGFDYRQSKFNRATQSLRQPGSSFKPFIYSAALDNGFTPATIVNDAPVVLDSAGQEESWRPENYSNRFYGPTRLREGLVRSMNLVSVRVLRKVGMRNALNHIRPFGFPPSALPRDLSLALGSGGAAPWQMAEGFSGLASGGLSVSRYFIDRILDADGNVVFQSEPAMVCGACAPLWAEGLEPASTIMPDLPDFAVNTSNVDQSADDEPAIDLDPEVPAYTSVEEMIAHASTWRPDYRETPLFWQDRNQAQRIVSEQNAYIVYDMMRDVIQRGTGRRARALERKDIGGKTGTSNNRRDAWFSGFNSELVGIGWIGFDNDSRSLGAGEEGSRTALPMWIDFMSVALAGTKEAPLQQPAGIVTVRISKDTGLLATAGTQNVMFEIFRAGSEPGNADEEEGFRDTKIFVEELNDASIF